MHHLPSIRSSWTSCISALPNTQPIKSAFAQQILPAILDSCSIPPIEFSVDGLWSVCDFCGYSELRSFTYNTPCGSGIQRIRRGIDVSLSVVPFAQRRCACERFESRHSNGSNVLTALDVLCPRHRRDRDVRGCGNSGWTTGIQADVSLWMDCRDASANSAEANKALFHLCIWAAQVRPESL